MAEARERLVTAATIYQFDPAGAPDQVWAYDWYSHLFFASQLLEAVRALVPIIAQAALEDAFAEYSAHWERPRGVRNVLLHPISRDVNVGWLWAFGDRLEYRKPGCDPIWVLNREDLHAPVEHLLAVVQEYR